MLTSLLLLAAKPTLVAIRVDQPDSAEVTITIPEKKSAFSMPAWAPGDYQLFNYGKQVASIEFKLDDKPVEATKEGENRWLIPSGATTVTYRVTPSRGNFSPNLQIREGDTFISPPGVVGYFEGTEKQPVEFEAPSGTVMMLPKSGERFKALDLDHFLDSPFVFGKAVRTESKTIEGKTLNAVAFGRTDTVSLRSFLEMGELAVIEGKRIFGEIPWERYAFLYDFGGPGGGLEHQDCCRIGISTRTSATNASGIIFHEYFHSYNVKRIRPLGLGPFDYSKPADGRTLWWLEGVTDYYAEVMRVRAGVISKPEFRQIMYFTNRAASGPAYQLISAEDAGKRVWENRGSFGFQGVSYYTKGKIVGAFLDLAIRGETRGRRSLDDVMHDLYQETKPPKPGYGPDRIRELCIKYGGPRMGELYDIAVRSSKPLPWDQVTDKMAIRFDETGINVVDGSPLANVGERWPDATTAR
jgi:predicted metalloprotease with PDZ domain